VDIGGTFTDLVLLTSAGAIATRKVSSTTDDYSRAIVTGLLQLLEELQLSPSAVDEVIHGTTVATNAILERKGVSTALITTKGFRDVLELQRIRIPETYNLFYEKPAPLVPRRRRFEVEERVGPKGQIWEPLNMESVAAAIELVKRSGAEAVAICLLNSYVNPDHERIVADACTRALPSVFVTHSTEILTEIREYERTSTAVISAYVGPIVKDYLESLGQQLRAIGVSAPLLVMQCNGGMMTADMACRRPAYLVESGPAAGVKGAAELAKIAGYDNVITLDMGGTTAKASAIEKGEVTLTSEYEVGGGINVSSMLVKGGGYALRVPVVDISEIGAGGGSIVWVDPGGRLQLGPRSAGAVPGPVCYSTGGLESTVTDANAVLGYLNPDYLAGGSVPLDTERAADVLKRDIADRIGLALMDAAYGVHMLASASMMRAVKAVSTFRGRDPRDAVLLAFGGMGPVCAAEMAKALQMTQIVVPPAAGLFSAFGLLFARIEHQIVQTYLRPAQADTVDELTNAFVRLEHQAASVLNGSGYGDERISSRRFADVRYADQGYELVVQVPAGPLQPGHVLQIVDDFGQEHMKTYGHVADDEPVDIVNLRVTSQVANNGSWVYDPSVALRSGMSHASAPSPDRRAYFGPNRGSVATPVLRRNDLPDKPLPGPFIIEEYDMTCVIPPGCEAALDERGNIVIHLG
jgi:N-methylhydantoinase A